MSASCSERTGAFVGICFYFLREPAKPASAPDQPERRMRMDWSSLMEETIRRAGVKPEEAARTLDALFDLIIERMSTDDLIMLRPDFGYFEMRSAGGEKSMHTQDLRKCRRTPVFKKSGQLKKQLRQDDEDYLRMLRSAGRDAQAERLMRKHAVGSHV
jgi:nucleoid DNA-binding protein